MSEIEYGKFAAVVMVLRRRDSGWEALAVARRGESDQWGLPGGKVESHETSVIAAVREFTEETGIRLTVGSPWILGHTTIAPVHRMIPQETVLDSDGYLTTFYLLDTTGMGLPERFDTPEGEEKARWVPLFKLCSGPYGKENRKRFEKLGILHSFTPYPTKL
jgi:8-oxo-dGTP pyrophosphatase MutT (NUDIX family)